MAGIKIKDATLVTEVKGTDRIPISDGSGLAKAATLELLNIFTQELGVGHVTPEGGEIFNDLSNTAKNKSHAEGENTKASGEASHSEGYSTEASGDYSHSEGSSTKTFAPYSHAEGYGTIAKGAASHAEGYLTEARLESGHAEGEYTISTNYGEHAEGQYNISNLIEGNIILSTQSSIGIGRDYYDRKNAQEVMQNGDFYVYGIGNYNGKLLDTVDADGMGTGEKLPDIKPIQTVISDIQNQIGNISTRLDALNGEVK